MRFAVLAALGLVTLSGCSLLVAPEADRIARGGGGEGGSGGDGGAGGAGAGGGCTTLEDCPASTNECEIPVCQDGACGFAPLPAGTPVAMQTEGDCETRVCDEAGAVVETPLREGTPCGTGLSSDAAGQCVGCSDASECPSGTECETAACDAGDVCGLDPVDAGTPLGAQTSGDCLLAVCDGAGATTTQNDDLDTPDDGLDCTIDGCSAGVPTTTDAAEGVACDDGGGAVCNGSGDCVGCNIGSECGTSTSCRTFTCDGGTCGFDDAPPGTACTEGGTKCDGSGACVECVTGPDCASGVCQGNVCIGATCMDLAHNGDETDVDCGGSCPPCGLGDGCGVADDCVTGNCATTCQPVVVVGTSPANGSNAASVTGAVSVIFSGAMDAATLTGKTTLDAGACSGSVQLSTDDFATCVPFTSATPVMRAGNTIAHFSPAPGLAFGSTFKVRVTTAAEDAQGDAIAATFTTTNGFQTRYGVDGSDVVISQVYGGGGNPGAPLSHDFVELHNRGPGAVSLAGWSLQYASPMGTTWSVTNLSGSIAPGGYFLVQLATGGPNGAALPAPDATGLSNLSAQSGKLALVRNATQLVGVCPNDAAITDLVGYGTSVCFEGAGAAAALSVTTAAARPGASCVDAGSNLTDFVAGAPSPRSSATAAAACLVEVTNESGLANEVDACSVELPVSLVLQTGASSGVVSALAFEGGVTEAAGAGANVVAELGFGPRTANPQHQPGWTWTAATFASQEGASDRYEASFTAPAPGAYGYAYRVSVDGGSTWTYCDLGGAGSDVGLTFETPRIPPLDVTN